VIPGREYGINYLTNSMNFIVEDKETGETKLVATEGIMSRDMNY